MVEPRELHQHRFQQLQIFLFGERGLALAQLGKLLLQLVAANAYRFGQLLLAEAPGEHELAGKRAIVYLTYAIDPGHALQKMSDAVAARGADVLGGQIIRRDKLAEGVADFVTRVLDVTADA